MDHLDHRLLGQRQDLFHLQDEARGMAFWHPRGLAIYRAIEDLVRRRMRRLGFGEVRSPQLIDASLWRRSGHLEKFGHAMFLVEDGEALMALKPMSCPCHVQIFHRECASWRDLPIRYAEFGACHRNEPSGSLHGLMRGRSFVQDDAHVFCLEEQVEGEVARFVGLLSRMYADLGFPSFRVALSARPADRAGDDALWDRAEGVLGAAARSCGLSYSEKPGEGAFYGPKLEFILSDRMGREWQCGTVQLDFVLPGRLGAEYVGPDGERKVPVMIHHAVLGSLERFVGILLEHHGGRLPFPLAPEQVAVLPVARDQAAHAMSVHEALLDAGIRSSYWEPSERLSRRMIDVRNFEVPVIAVVGSREVEANGVNVKFREAEMGVVPLDEVAASIRAAARHEDIGG